MRGCECERVGSVACVGGWINGRVGGWIGPLGPHWEMTWEIRWGSMVGQ